VLERAVGRANGKKYMAMPLTTSGIQVTRNQILTLKKSSIYTSHFPYAQVSKEPKSSEEQGQSHPRAVEPPLKGTVAPYSKSRRAKRQTQV